MRPPIEKLILLKRALYAPDGLYPNIRRAEVKEKVGKIYRFKPWKHGRRHEFLLVEDVERARKRLE